MRGQLARTDAEPAIGFSTADLRECRQQLGRGAEAELRCETVVAETAVGPARELARDVGAQGIDDSPDGLDRLGSRDKVRVVEQTRRGLLGKEFGHGGEGHRATMARASDAR